jgi:hypothetical protein
VKRKKCYNFEKKEKEDEMACEDLIAKQLLAIEIKVRIDISF